MPPIFTILGDYKIALYVYGVVWLGLVFLREYAKRTKSQKTFLSLNVFVWFLTLLPVLVITLGTLVIFFLASLFPI